MSIWEEIALCVNQLVICHIGLFIVFQNTLRHKSQICVSSFWISESSLSSAADHVALPSAVYACHFRSCTRPSETDGSRCLVVIARCRVHA